MQTGKKQQQRSAVQKKRLSASYGSLIQCLLINVGLLQHYCIEGGVHGWPKIWLLLFRETPVSQKADVSFFPFWKLRKVYEIKQINNNKYSIFQRIEDYLQTRLGKKILFPSFSFQLLRYSYHIFSHSIQLLIGITGVILFNFFVFLLNFSVIIFQVKK